MRDAVVLTPESVTVRVEYNLVLYLLSLYYDEYHPPREYHNNGNMKLRGMYCRYAAPQSLYPVRLIITSKTETDSGGG